MIDKRKYLIQLKLIGRQFRQNWPDFWVDFRFSLYCLLIAAALDVISTHHFMSLGGPQIELHPYIRFLSIHFGIIWGPIIGKLSQLLFGLPVIIYLRRYAAWLIWSATLLYLSAFCFNIYVTAIRFGLTTIK